MEQFKIIFNGKRYVTEIFMGNSVDSVWEGLDAPFVIADKELKEFCPRKHFSRTVLLDADDRYVTLVTVAKLIEWLSSKKCTPESSVVALGGESIASIAGAVAALYDGGIKWRTVPTTLYAMLEVPLGYSVMKRSSVFYPPEHVAVNLEYIRSLEDSAYLSGVGELIRTAVIGGELLYDMALQFQTDISRRTDTVLSEFIRIAAGIKAEISESSGIFLDAGRTLGDMICDKYKIPYGIAVSAGLLMETKIGVMLGVSDYSVTDEIEEMLRMYGIKHPYTLSGYGVDIEKNYIIPFISDIGNPVVEKISGGALKEFIEQL